MKTVSMAPLRLINLSSFYYTLYDVALVWIPFTNLGLCFGRAPAH